MNRTTPNPARDVTALFPGIERCAVTATRLHPRPGHPGPRASHVGGPLRWPAGEPWPACAADHLVPVELPMSPALRDRLAAARQTKNWAEYESVVGELATRIPGFAGIDRRTGSALGHAVRPAPAPTPYVAVAQLRVADVPDLCPPDDTDLLQVLWCPHHHDNDTEAWAPAVSLRWRREAGTPPMRDRPPAPAESSVTRYLPRPCVLSPERIVEYPWWQELPADLAHRVHAWDTDHEGLYHRQLSTAPGWKVGGWPSWPTTDPVPAYCPRCASPLRLLLQIDSGEWGDPVRWRPREERDLGASPEPTGVVAGRTGLYRIFGCPSCPDPPIRVDLQ